MPLFMDNLLGLWLSKIGEILTFSVVKSLGIGRLGCGVLLYTGKTLFLYK